MNKMNMIALATTMGLLSFQPLMKNDTQYVTSVRYDAQDMDLFTLSLKVFGKGTVYDGEQAIKEGFMNYELRNGEEKQFRIVPEVGYEIRNIYYDVQSNRSNRHDIKNQMVGNMLTLKSIDEHMDLEIIFEKTIKGEVIKDQVIQVFDKQETPITGSKESHEQGYIWMMISSYLVMLYIKNKEAKEKKRYK